MFDTANVGKDISQILPIVIIWATACVVLLGDVFLWRTAKDANPIVAAIGVLVALVAAVSSVADGGAAFGDGIRMDVLASVSGIILLVAALLSILMAWTYLKNRGMDHGEYYVLLLLSVSGAMLMAAANDLIVLFLGLEMLSFALYVLAGFARGQSRSQEASVKYFLLGAFASAFFLYGIALTYGACKTTDIAHIGAWALAPTTHFSAMLLAGVAFILVGLGFKAAVMPFHQWTPDVYEGAPTSVTAFMAAAAKIGAFAALLRVFGALAPVHQYWLPAVQVMAILTMVIGNMLAVKQTNLKRLLAYSSIAHAGYLLVAVASLSSGDEATRQAAQSGALFYLFAYTFMTLGAFAVLIYLGNRGKDYQTVNDLTGLVRHDALAGYAMVFFMLSLGGIPPTMGFWGKWQLFYAALTGGQLMLAIVMGLSSAIGVFYYLKVVWVMCFEQPFDKAPAAGVSRFGAIASVGLSAVATVLFGILPNLIIRFTGLVR